MSCMLLSINPDHVENILLGIKLYEFRRVRCKQDVDRLIIYSTAPVKMVVAEAEIEEIIEDDIETVWSLTGDYSGISYGCYISYFHGKKKAVAYKLRNVQKYKEPKPLSDFGLSRAPQSFV